MESCRPRWAVRPALPPEELSRILAELHHLELTPLVVQLLANRGFTDPGKIEAFLLPSPVDQYPDPHLLVGVSDAVERIARAIERHEKVAVYGDYDADGVTATALLTIALRHFGLQVEPYIPNRVQEGYGLNASAVREIAGRGARLLITVDCGISGRPEVEEARKAGLDVIVTDHHYLPEDLPEAAACINPKQHADGCECYDHLAGVGVAYQLVRALVKKCGKPKGLRNKDLLALVAIGTVADVVPLMGANRSLVLHGMAALPEHSLPGLRTLIEYAGLKLERIDSDKIGFIIGPRLNAAGRIDDARISYQLLLTEDPSEAALLAQKLQAHNRTRQAMMNHIIEQARERVRKMDGGARLIVLADPEWPSGVVGLVAGRLVEEFGRPVLVIEQGEEESRGSARSIPALNIVEALNEVKDLLVRHGGHSAAAGFTIRTENLGAFQEKLRQVVESRLASEDLQPVIYADAELDISAVCDATLESINRLAPFGSSNPSPLFMANGVKVLDAQVVGNGAHLKMIVMDAATPGGQQLEAIAFGQGHVAELVKRRLRVDLLFYIERKEWQGETHLQLRVRDLRIP